MLIGIGGYMIPSSTSINSITSAIFKFKYSVACSTSASNKAKKNITYLVYVKIEGDKFSINL